LAGLKAGQKIKITSEEKKCADKKCLGIQTSRLDGQNAGFLNLLQLMVESPSGKKKIRLKVR
jgi:hypothetical protein